MLTSLYWCDRKECFGSRILPDQLHYHVRENDVFGHLVDWVVGEDREGPARNKRDTKIKKVRMRAPKR